MFLDKAIIDAYLKEYGSTNVCREVFAQTFTKEFKAIQAMFGTYAHFLVEVECHRAAQKPAVARPIVTPEVKK